MQRLRKALCILLCATMVFSIFPVAHAAQTQPVKKYRIYPIVRSLSYDGSEFSIGSEVNVVYESGIDGATKG